MAQILTPAELDRPSRSPTPRKETCGLSNPGLVALGIKEALTTTAAGLIVAVPTQIVYNALSARVTKITGDIEAMANFLLEVREEMTT